MSKVYVSEEELKEIYDMKFSKETWEFFDEWLETKIEQGEVERIEFDHYEVSKLKY